MRGAFLLWDDLLLQLSAGSTSFLDLLLATMIRKLSVDELDESGDVASDKALYHWIIHLSSDSKWQAHAAKYGWDIRGLIMQECCLRPSATLKQLGDTVLSQELRTAPDGKDFHAHWGAIFEAAMSSEDEELAQDRENLTASKRSPEEAFAKSVEDDDVQHSGGWRRDSRDWRPLPIGVVQI